MHVTAAQGVPLTGSSSPVGGLSVVQFTSMSKDFQGTLDYILYTSDSLVPTAALDLPEESEVASPEGPGLPNEQWVSDHIALMAEFGYRLDAPSLHSDKSTTPP